MFNLTPTNWQRSTQTLANINPELPALLTNAGIFTDPGYLAFLDGTSSTFDPAYGGYNPDLILSDLWNMLVWSTPRPGMPSTDASCLRSDSSTR